MTKPTKEEVKDFLRQSNNIEREYSDQSLKDAMRAWRWAYVNRNKIDLDYILKVHWLLARNSRPDIAGKIRGCEVWIDGQEKYFISEALIKEELQNVINKLVIPRFIPCKEEEFTKSVHIEFENIHPFIDFNGRIGRILMNIHRIKLGLPILIIRGWKDGDNKYHKEQANYYEWFK